MAANSRRCGCGSINRLARVDCFPVSAQESYRTRRVNESALTLPHKDHKHLAMARVWMDAATELELADLRARSAATPLPSIP
jgi:hypothetical protein